MDFEDFYGKYVDRVASYVLRHTSLRDAEDIVAETFTVAWRKRIERLDDPMPWLIVTARNITRQVRRREVSAGEITARLIDLIETSSPSAEITAMRRREITEALAGLDEVSREALLLTTWDGLQRDRCRPSAGHHARRETVGSTSYARGFLSGTYDGTTFTARTVAELYAIEVDPPPSVSPAAVSAKALISCDVTVNADPSNGLNNELLKFPGLEAYWVDMDAKTYMVAISGDVGVAVTAVKKAVEGPACIGALPATGTLADLVTAVKKLKAAKINGVLGAEVAVQSGAFVQVDVVANVPALREKVAEVVGASIPLAISPALFATTS